MRPFGWWIEIAPAGDDESGVAEAMELWLSETALEEQRRQSLAGKQIRPVVALGVRDLRSSRPAAPIVTMRTPSGRRHRRASASNWLGPSFRSSVPSSTTAATDAGA